MSDLRTYPREFIIEFIELYKAHPCIWKIKSKEYSDRDKKRNAYDILVNKFKEIDPTATRDVVTRKINSMRTIYRKELMKIVKSQRSGAGEEDVYSTNLWYFDQLSFLSDQEVPRKSTSNLDEDSQTAEDIGNINGDEQGTFESGYSNVSNPSTPATREEPRSPATLSLNSSSTPTPTPSTSNVIRKKRKNSSEPDETTQVLQLVGEKLRSQRPDDAFDIFGKHIANKLRNLEERQNLIAQKLISDVVFDAEMQRLTTGSKVVDYNNHSQYHTGPTMAPPGYGYYQIPQGVSNFQQAMPQGVSNFQRAMPQGVSNFQQAMPQGVSNCQQVMPQGNHVTNLQSNVTQSNPSSITQLINDFVDNTDE